MSVYTGGAPGTGMVPGTDYEPMTQQGLGGEYYGDPAMMPNASTMPNAYPAGTDMNPYGGGTAFRGPPGGSDAGGLAVSTNGHGGGFEGGHDGGHGGHAGLDKDTAQYGNMGRLTRGVDYYGRVCGLDPGVSNLPFLYWCRNDAPSNLEPNGLDLDRPSCVAACPVSTNNTIKIPCLQKQQTNNGKNIPGGQFGNLKTQVVMMQQSIVNTAPYATRARGGRYCMPINKNLESSVLNDNRALGPFSPNRALVWLGTLGHLYWLLFCAMLLAIVVSIFYLYCMEHCPRFLAYFFLGPTALFCALMAIYFTLAIIVLINKGLGFSEWYTERNPLYRQWDVYLASVFSLFLAIFLWIVAITLGGMIWNFDGAGITDLVHCAHACIKAVPFMAFIPIFQAVAYFFMMWFGLQGFRLMASLGYVVKNRIVVNGARFAGLSRLFVPPFYDWRWYFVAIVWLFFFGWMMETITAFCEYLVSYCTFKYYFVPKEKGKKDKGSAAKNTLCTGLRYGLIYHFGSILKAATVVPLWRPWRILYWLTSEISGDGSPPTTCFGKAIKCFEGLACGCCGLEGCCGLQATSMEKTRQMECSLKDGLSDVVVRANDFDEGSVQAHVFLEHKSRIVQYLYRDLSQTTINITGVCGISTLCSGLVYTVVANLDIYKEPTSTLYVADPFLVSFLAWVLSAYIVFGFMMLWDHCADTLLFCYVWNKVLNRKTVDKFIPQDLRWIVGNDDLEDDRYPYYGRAKNNMYLRYWLPMVGAQPKKKAVENKTTTKQAPMSSMVGTQGPPPGPAMSEAQGSWMSGFGSGLWQRQEQAISAGPETAPFLG